ncbi:MAG: 1,4-alpha-glucan branching enzyme, partial [Pseudomonadota bacterium]
MDASAEAVCFDESDLEDIARGRRGDLFSVLGAQPAPRGWRLAAFVPGAEEVRAVDLTGEAIAGLAPQGGDVFAALLPHRPEAWRFEARRGSDRWVEEDPYRFGPILGAQDEHYISEGTHGR